MYVVNTSKRANSKQEAESVHSNNKYICASVIREAFVIIVIFQL